MRRRTAGRGIALGIAVAAVAAFPGAAPAETGYTRDFNFGACGGFAAAGEQPVLQPTAGQAAHPRRSRGTGRGSA